MSYPDLERDPASSRDGPKHTQGGTGLAGFAFHRSCVWNLAFCSEVPSRPPKLLTSLPKIPPCSLWLPSLNHPELLPPSRSFPARVLPYQSPPARAHSYDTSLHSAHTPAAAPSCSPTSVSPRVRPLALWRQKPGLGCGNLSHGPSEVDRVHPPVLHWGIW